MAVGAALLNALACGRIGYEIVSTADDAGLPAGDGAPRDDSGLPVLPDGASADRAPFIDGSLTSGDRATDAGPPAPDGSSSPDTTAPPPDGPPPPLADGSPPPPPVDGSAPPPVDSAPPPPPVDSGPPPPVDSRPPPPPDSAAPPPDGGAGVTVNGQNGSARVGWTDFGTAFMDLCPAGEVVIGYLGFQAPSPTMPWMRAVQTQCGRLAVGPGPSSPVTTTAATLFPVRGLEGGTAWSRLCPTNQVVVGFGGRSSGYLDQLIVRCAPLSVSGQPGSQTISIGAITALPPTDSGSGSAFSSIDCPAGQLASGSNVTADNYPRSFGLFCGTPTVSQ
jgi:hypothetical protein